MGGVLVLDGVVDVFVVFEGVHVFGGDEGFFGAEITQAAVFAMGGVEAALDAVFIDGQAFEGAVGSVVGDDGCAEEGFFDLLRGVGRLGDGEVVGAVELLFDEGVEDAASEGLGLLEPPVEIGDAVGQGGLEGADGVDVVFEGVAEGGEFGVLFGADEEAAGEQAVLEGVLGDGVFTFGGFGAG